MRIFLRTPLLVSLLVALACVFSGDARDAEHLYWNPWFRYMSVPAPDTAVVVSLDDGLLDAASTAAGSTARQAELLDKLAARGAKHIYLDMPEAVGADPANDSALYKVLERLDDKVTLVIREPSNEASLSRRRKRVDTQFASPSGTRIAVSKWNFNVFEVPIDGPPALERDGKIYPAAALVAAGLMSMDGKVYANYRIDPRSIPVVLSRDLLTGRAHGSPAQATLLPGRDVFVTRTNESVATSVASFGYDRIPQAFVDIASAAGLAAGRPVSFAGHPLLILFLFTVIAAKLGTNRSAKCGIYVLFGVVMLAGPGLLMMANVHTDIGSAIIAVAVYIPLRLWQKWRQGVQLTSSASGLPNVDALVSDGIPGGSDVAAACISNFEQMLVSLPKDLHGECSRQIARRLSVAFGGSKIYDNGDGHFVWLVQPFSTDELVAQLEGLKALFAAPLVIGEHILDTNIHFGLDRNSANRPINRVKSAIASSSEAVSKLKLYEEYGSERLAQTPWELSLHARIDAALRSGDSWLAVQPKFNLRDKRISGAEALIRWTDPERGPIPPDTFILQAERAGRIDTITYWVLDEAVRAACELNRHFAPFSMSVNLSARIVDQPGLVEQVLTIIDRHGLDHSLLTFEVTETFDMTNRDVAKENLAALRALGCGISIDDFGTGYASLAYLSEIATDEIKLDRRFVAAIGTSPRDRAIVENIIRLAHSMGQETVGEGVEDMHTLQLLRSMDCDAVQGYFIGRPVKLPELTQMLEGGRAELSGYS